MFYLCIALLTIKHLNIEFFFLQNRILFPYGSKTRICEKLVRNMINLAEVYFKYRDLKAYV